MSGTENIDSEVKIMALTVLAVIVIIIGLCSDYKNHNMKYPEPKNPYLRENSKRCEEIYKKYGTK